MHDVFISYADEDKEVAEKVCAILEGRGLSCWIAPRDVPPGREWAEAIVDAIEQTKVFVLVFSQHSNTSAAIIAELEKAFSNQVTIFLFRIRKVEPSKRMELFVRTSQWLDAFTWPIDQQIQCLADGIEAVLRPPVEHPVSHARADGFQPAESETTKHSPRMWLRWVVLGCVALAGILFWTQRQHQPPSEHPETEIEAARVKSHVSVQDFMKMNVESHIIKQKTGGRIVGEIVNQDDTEIIVKINIGTVTIPRDNIESMEVKLVEIGDVMSPQEIYMKKLEQIDQNDPESHFLLGLFCLEKGLDEYSEREFNKARELDELYKIQIEEAKAKYFYERAMTYYSNKNYREAAGYFNKIIQEFPNNNKMVEESKELLSKCMNEIKKEESKRVCPSCNGKKICLKCDGNGFAICYVCKGSGYYGTEKVGTKCIGCRGRGYTTRGKSCRLCGGTGYVLERQVKKVCYSCDGTGKVGKCSYCYGTGKCSKCDGTGFIYN